MANGGFPDWGDGSPGDPSHQIEWCCSECGRCAKAWEDTRFVGEEASIPCPYCKKNTLWKKQ
jgi:DNA-directed RNA polymerase subunit RPC12/RpoP